MLTSTPAGSSPDASPAASLIITADAAAFAALAPDIRKRASKWSVATTKSYYGFNVRPRQVRSIACIRDAERIAATLAYADADDRAVAFGYLCRLNAALAKAEAAVAATRADYDACDARRQAARDREVASLLRGKCAALWRRHDAADDRARDIARARDIVAEALVATAQEGVTRAETRAWQAAYDAAADAGAHPGAAARAAERAVEARRRRYAIGAAARAATLAAQRKAEEGGAK